MEHIKNYLILTAFPWRQWLRERAPMLRYAYSACLVKHTAAKPNTSDTNTGLSNVGTLLKVRSVCIFTFSAFTVTTTAIHCAGNHYSL
jgi:hypothetical protein